MLEPRKLHVAAAQLPGLPLADAAESLRRIDAAITQAGEMGVELLVLPECAYPAYYVESLLKFREADHIGSEAFVKHLAERVRDAGITAICGFVEEAGDKLFNTAVIIDPSGAECGRYRKTVMWGAEGAWTTPGWEIKPIDTACGRIGMLICADGRAPEVAAGLVAQGAELLVVPTCWVNVAEKKGEYVNAQADFMARARVRELRVPLIAADKTGVEHPDFSYVGQSMIIAADGTVIAQASADQPELIDAEVTLAEPPRPEIPFWAERRLFGDYPAVEINPEELGAIRLALVPAGVGGGQLGAQFDILTDLANDGIEVVAVAETDEERLDRLEVHGHTLGLTVVGRSQVERLMVEQFGAFGIIAAEHVDSFVASRVMALDGAAIVFVLGQTANVDILRCRAAENRVFVAAVLENAAYVINPVGRVTHELHEVADAPLILDLELNGSADKIVCPGTHVWEQRRPNVYADAFGIRLPADSTGRTPPPDQT